MNRLLSSGRASCTSGCAPRTFVRIASALIALLAIAYSPVAWAAATARVSVTSDGLEGNAQSGRPAISSNGRYVAFESDARLVPADTDNRRDIYRHDTQTGQTICVSVSDEEIVANDDCQVPAISGDGRFVAFDTVAANLVAGDTNGVGDVFVHDCETGETTRVSVATDSTPGNNHSYAPAISADGRYVAFISSASSLVADDTNGQDDVFVHDRQTGSTNLVSISTGGDQGNDCIVGYCDISEHGRYVVFGSWADNLVADDTNASDDVFVHDCATSTTVRASVADDGTEGDYGGEYPSISNDGQYVCFQSSSTNLVGGDTNDHGDVYVRDMFAGRTRRVSVSSGGLEANGHSFFPAISPDGATVVFVSAANNLVSGDANGADDVFARDLQTAQTIRISLSDTGKEANGSCEMSDVATSGSFVVFDSHADNLVPGDSNGQMDVFLRGMQAAAHTISFTAGPSGSPNPVDPSGAVQCSVTGEDSRGHSLSYQWSAEDDQGASVGSFDDPSLRNPAWTAPGNDTDEPVEYTISVTATCPKGAEADASFTVTVNPPPRKVAYVCVDDHPDDDGTGMDLVWPASPDDGNGTDSVVRYNIFRMEQGGSYVHVTNVAATDAPAYSFTDTGLRAMTRYCYAIRARSNSASSEAAWRWCRTVNNNRAAPGQPQNLACSEVSAGGGLGVRIGWDKSPEDVSTSVADAAESLPVTRYYIFRRQYPDGSFVYLSHVDADGSSSYHYDDPGRAHGQNLQYAVRAYDGNRQSTPAFAQIHLQDDTAPGPPQNFLAKWNRQGNGRSMRLEWDASADDGGGADDVKEYLYWRRLVPGGTLQFGGRIPASGASSYAWLDTGLIVETSYEYFIRASDGTNQSTLKTDSGTTKDTCPPGAPANLSATYLGSGNGVEVSWDKSPDDGGGLNDVIGYRLWASINGGTWGMQKIIKGDGSAGYTATCSALPDAANIRLILEAWDGYNRSKQIYTEVSTKSPSNMHVFSPSERPYMIGLPGGARVEAGCMAYWDPVGGKLVPADETVAGQGYVAQFQRAVETAARPEVRTVTYPVKRGWNLIASPFTEPIGFDGAKGPILPYAWTDQGHGYKLAAAVDLPGVSTMLQPWQSYWVYAESDGELTFERTAESSDVRSLTADANAWLIRLVAEAGTEADACNWIGANTTDVHIPNPPQLSNVVDLHIVADQPMAASTQPPAAEMRWNVVVSSIADEPVRLSFPDLSEVPNRYRLTLVDETAGKTVNMRTTGSYTVSGDARLTIRAIEGNGNTLTISGVSTQQTGCAATIAYTLSADADVTVDIRNIAGRLINRIARGTQTAGLNSATWNLRNRSGATVPSGTYLCTITARADDGTQTSSVRTMHISR